MRRWLALSAAALAAALSLGACTTEVHGDAHVAPLRPVVETYERRDTMRDGIYVVGPQVRPGRWRTSGPGPLYPPCMVTVVGNGDSDSQMITRGGGFVDLVEGTRVSVTGTCIWWPAAS